MGLRLDLEAAQRQRLSGILVVTVALAAALLTAVLVEEGRVAADRYLGAWGHEVSSVHQFEKLIRGSKPVAVMFMSRGCPLCERMYPYWAALEVKSDSLPLDFYHVVLTAETAELFQRYGVRDTPTFIVFANGKPVARHVGPFTAGGEGVSNAMLAWAVAAAGSASPVDPRGYAEQGLKVYRVRCASCHGVLKSLDREHVEEWLEAAEKTAVDPKALVACSALRERVEEALRRGAYLHEVYPGGFDGLVAAVLSMRKYVPDLLYYEAQRTAYLLDYATAVLEGRRPPVFEWMNLTGAAAEAEAAQAVESVHQYWPPPLGVAGVAAALAAGVATALSPCSFPLLLAYLSALACSGRRVGAGSCVLCGAAAAAGVVVVGALALAASSLVAAAQHVVALIVSAVLVAAGASSLLGVPAGLGGAKGSRKRGFLGFCAAYGFLAVHCNLPLIAGALLLLAGLGPTVAGVAALASLAAGVAVPLAVLAWLASKGTSLVGRAVKRAELLGRAGGAVMFLAGIYILLHCLELA